MLNFLDESPERKTSFIEISRGGKLPYKTGSPAISRSEERFSRNAETELVCRLLLEKKKVASSLPLGLNANPVKPPRAPVGRGAPEAWRVTEFHNRSIPLSFFFSCCGDPGDLHSFPTRRSSDLNHQNGKHPS